jgi:plasmid maintenance system antidote protein VapI
MKMNLEEIKKALKDRQLKAVAEAIKVHPNCLYRLVNGITAPRKSTLEKVQRYLTNN